MLLSLRVLLGQDVQAHAGRIALEQKRTLRQGVVGIGRKHME